MFTKASAATDGDGKQRSLRVSEWVVIDEFNDDPNISVFLLTTRTSVLERLFRQQLDRTDVCDPIK
jgi:hypothetical protein